MLATVLLYLVILTAKLYNKNNLYSEYKRRGKEAKPAAPTTKKCPYCKTEIAIDATRCPHCTSMLEETKETK